MCSCNNRVCALELQAERAEARVDALREVVSRVLDRLANEGALSSDLRDWLTLQSGELLNGS